MNLRNIYYTETYKKNKTGGQFCPLNEGRKIMKEKFKNFYDVFAMYINILIFIAIIGIVIIIGLIGDKIFHENPEGVILDYFEDGLIYGFALLVVMILGYLLILSTMAAVTLFIEKVKFFRKICKNPLTVENLEKLDFESLEEYIKYLSDYITVKYFDNIIIHFEKKHLICSYSRQGMNNLITVCIRKGLIKDATFVGYEITKKEIILIDKLNTDNSVIKISLEKE